MLSEEKLRDIADWVGASFDVLLSHELEAANELLRECNGLFGEHSVRYADSCSGLFYETFSELPSVEPVFVTCPNQLWDALQPYASKQIRELVARKTMADMVLRCEEMHFHCVLAVSRVAQDRQCMTTFWSVVMEKENGEEPSNAGSILECAQGDGHIEMSGVTVFPSPHNPFPSVTSSTPIFFPTAAENRRIQTRPLNTANQSSAGSWKDLRWRKTLPDTSAQSCCAAKALATARASFTSKLAIAFRLLRQRLQINQQCKTSFPSNVHKHRSIECAALSSVSLCLPIANEVCIPVVQAAIVPRGWRLTKTAAHPDVLALLYNLAEIGRKTSVPLRPYLCLEPGAIVSRSPVVRLRIPDEKCVFTVWETTQGQAFLPFQNTNASQTGPTTDSLRKQLVAVTRMVETVLHQTSAPLFSVASTMPVRLQGCYVFKTALS